MFRHLVLALLATPAIALAGAPGDEFLGDQIPYSDSYLTVAPAVVSTKKTTIDVAADTLVPRGDNWSISITEDAAGKPVTWANENLPWNERLQAMAKNSGLEAAIDKDTRRVHIKNSAASAGSAHAGALTSGAAMRGATKASASNGQSSTKAKPNQIETAPFEYVVRVKDLTLSKAFERWAKQAGWTVDWQAKQIDYPISSEATFSGEFVVAATSMFEALSNMGSSLGFSVATNRHIIVHTIK